MATEIPKNWKRTSRKPVVVDGHEFLSYHAGIMRYHLHCAAIDAVVAADHNLTTYHASVGGVFIKSPRTGRPHRFTTERRAIEGAVAEASRKRI